jgi:hypothetical protein
MSATQGPYPIVEHIPEFARQQAATERYRSKRAHSRKDRRNEAGQCPLGAALRAMGLPCASAPTSHEVARRLTEGDGADPAIQEAAMEFINDWDEGRITDLAAALGVS